MTTKPKQRAVVICPGRGTYNKSELGYLTRQHQNKSPLLSVIDEYRMVNKQISVSELDALSNYSMAKHTAGENASSLIYACAAADFADIDMQRYDIVGITGNSMGWYIALALSQALNPANAIQLINTMGSMMQNGVIGGQVIYPVSDTNWQLDQQAVQTVYQHIHDVNQLDQCECYISIKLGGYLVLAGNEKGLQALEQRLPKVDDIYPMRLFNHAAFHTPLLNEVSLKAKQLMPDNIFTRPAIPLIDGRGHVWQPYHTDISALWDYTLGQQVTETYDFSTAVEVALKEFAPDKLILLGPGGTLGGAIGQCISAHKWQDIIDKNAFVKRQKNDPFLLSMGLEEQRAIVVKQDRRQ
jgi:[acyl-carrier-protein] S-malonyltransferase